MIYNDSIDLNISDMVATISAVGKQNEGYKSEEELEKAKIFFNYIPIYITHPPGDEMFYSYDKIVGYTTDSSFEDGKVKVKFNIFDNKLDEVMNWIKEKGIDVSIGYFATLKDINKDEQDKYNRAKWFETDIYPVHVAFVEKGACSIDAGCGCFLNEEQPITKNDETVVVEEVPQIVEPETNKEEYRENPGIEEMPNYWAYRVRDPDEYEKDTFRTIKITDGVLAIVARKKGAKTTSVQALRFDKSKFKIKEDVQEWLNKHPSFKASGNDCNCVNLMLNGVIEFFEDKDLPKDLNTNNTNITYDNMINEEHIEVPVTEDSTVEENAPVENAGWVVPKNPSEYGKSTAPWNGKEITVDAPDSIFLFVNSELPPSTGRVCPHHEPSSPYNVNRRGVIAAYAAVKGARGGIRSDVPSEVVQEGLAHLKNHYSEFEINWPEEDEALAELIDEFFEPAKNEVDVAKLEKEITEKFLEKERVIDEIKDKVEYSKDELLSFSINRLMVLKDAIAKIKVEKEVSTTVINSATEEKPKAEVSGLSIGNLYKIKRSE
jgi:hypothetical protein